MKSLTNGNPRSADGSTPAAAVGALSSSDAGAISSSGGSSTLTAEGAVESGVGGDGDRVNGDAVLPTTASETGSPLGLQRKSLRVTFPEFEVVSGYMDPPRPWNDVSQCSTDELIASYLNACNKVGVKPNARLLSQLQVITNFDDRNETLILKNENLDARHCETLEEVFRRVQFRTIDLEATKLEEEGAVTIFDMIEYYESCMKLNISYSKNLGQRGWQACSRMIRKTPCLENLEARGAVLSDFVMPILGRSLRVSSSLSSLHLEFAATSGKPLQVLVAALKVNETLKELYLADNKLMPSDGIQLGSLLRYNRTLHLLDLRNNHLQDAGFQHICEGVWEQGKGNGLNTLVIWNNQLSYHAMNHLSKALFNSASLETINLGHNNLTSEGMHRLKESLLQNKTLLRIGLQAAKITCEGAVALAEFIAESINLVRLDLRENDIKTGGLMALSLALRVSQSVTRIDLDKEPKKESGMKDYAEQQKRLLNDITTYMQRNRMLARQREEEENSKESERPSSQNPDEQTVSSSEEKRNEEEEAECEATGCEEVICPEVEGVVALDDQKECGSLSGESSPRHRMNLTLELKTRCEMLESPDFVSESEMPTADLPTADVAAATSTPPVARVMKCKVPVDIPPSPMVSAQGKTVLVPVRAGILSPGYDEEALSGGGTKSEEFSVDPSCHSGPEDCSSTSVSETDRLLASKSSEFGDKPVSPLPSLGSNLPISNVDKNGMIPLTADSYPSAVDSSPSRSQNKKSSLKMTRPRHRFQVSKANLSHKPGGRRGSGGSHKSPHTTTEHSRREGAHIPSLMASLAAFQSTIAVPLSNNSVVDSKLSKVSSDAVAPSGTVGEKDLADRGLGSFPIAEKQSLFEVSNLPNTSTEPHSSTQDVALHSHCVSSPECDVADSHSFRAEQGGPPRTFSEPENADAPYFSEIQPSIPSSNKEVIVDKGTNIIPVPEYPTGVSARDVESLPIVDQVSAATSASRTIPDDAVSIVRDEADGAEMNEPAKHQGQRRNNSNEKSSLHILNGVTCDFPDNAATDLENFGDNDALKLHVEKAQNNSEQSVV